MWEIIIKNKLFQKMKLISLNRKKEKNLKIFMMKLNLKAQELYLEKI